LLFSIAYARAFLIAPFVIVHLSISYKSNLLSTIEQHHKLKFTKKSVLTVHCKDAVPVDTDTGDAIANTPKSRNGSKYCAQLSAGARVKEGG
jgi:hypothetical protein